MSVEKKVAVVTGSNKGIGFEIVKSLCKKFDGIVYLTARNVDLGHKAVEELKKIGLAPNFHQLDITDAESVRKFAEYLQQTYGGIDILINNAAVYIKSDDVKQESKNTIEINFTGTLNISNALFPLLRANARVVNVSSRLGLLCRVTDSKLREKISNSNNTVEDIVNIVDEYLKACEDGTSKAKGYPDRAYDFSKVALNALTRIQQKNFDSETHRTGILISAVCPGYCKTDMSDNKGLLAPEVGAQTIVKMALVPADYDGPKGELWGEEKLVDWASGGMFTQTFRMFLKVITSKFSSS